MLRTKTLLYALTGLFVVYLIYSNRPSSGLKAASPKSPVEPTKPVSDVYDPEVELHNIINQEPYSPVIIFSKSYCPFCKKAKKILLEDSVITPAPVVVELDLHPHGKELQAELAKLTGRRTVPNVMVAKVSRGGGDDMAALADSGKLKEQFEDWAQGYLQVTHP